MCRYPFHDFSVFWYSHYTTILLNDMAWFVCMGRWSQRQLTWDTPYNWTTGVRMWGSLPPREISTGTHRELLHRYAQTFLFVFVWFACRVLVRTYFHSKLRLMNFLSSQAGTWYSILAVRLSIRRWEVKHTYILYMHTYMLFPTVARGYHFLFIHLRYIHTYRYTPPVRINGQGAHQCVNLTEWVLLYLCYASITYSYPSACVCMYICMSAYVSILRSSYNLCMTIIFQMRTPGGILPLHEDQQHLGERSG